MVKKDIWTLRILHLYGQQPVKAHQPCPKRRSEVVLTSLLENLINATKEAGIYIPDDQASGNAFGGYFCPHNMNPVTVTRSSAKEAYYDTAVTRPNFHLIAENQVTRIITETSNGTVKVTGIEVR